MLLVGLMGSGKSTVARAIAAMTEWPCLDNDVLLQRSTGRTAAELLAEHGVEHLRASESNVLTLLLSLPAPFVAGVAAGTVLDPYDRERMRSAGHVVWLRTSPPVLLRRVGAQSARAWLDGNPEQVLSAMAAERDPLYAEVAHQVLDMDRLSPRAAARAVVAAVRGE